MAEYFQWEDISVASSDKIGIFLTTVQENLSVTLFLSPPKLELSLLGGWVKRPKFGIAVVCEGHFRFP